MRLTMLFATLIFASPMNSFSGPPAVATSAGVNLQRVTIPAGTRILVRTDDWIDSRRSRPGTRFTGTLETNLQADGVTVARRGTTVHGILTEARRAGRTSRGANLTLELTDIVINGTATPIVTQSFELRTRGRGPSTARRGIGGAGLGAVVGGLAGGGSGAAIGAVLGGGTGTALAASRGGRQIDVPAGSLIEFRLAQPVSIRPIT